jgi:tryptophan 2,3-dioxygenase
MYHQVNELIFKMILWEMKQISYCENRNCFFTERLMRISRYFDMLTTSFSIMEDEGGSIHEVQKHFDSCELFSKRPVSIN